MAGSVRRLGWRAFSISFREAENSFTPSCLHTWKNGAAAIILISNGVSDGGKSSFDGTVAS